jgi:hypothetical protein
MSELIVKRLQLTRGRSQHVVCVRSCSSCAVRGSNDVAATREDARAKLSTGGRQWLRDAAAGEKGRLYGAAVLNLLYHPDNWDVVEPRPNDAMPRFGHRD